MGCGVLGIVLKQDTEDLGAYARIGLSILNHRGEDAHGLSFFDSQSGRFETRKDLGLVKNSKIFGEPPIEDPLRPPNPVIGDALIGHTRYRTSSTDSLANAQPIQFTLSDGRRAAIAHNGNLTNDKDLKKELRLELVGISDTGVLGLLLGRNLRKEDPVGSVREVMSKVRGSYCITLLIEGTTPTIMAMRDPYGYMPLNVGSNEDGFFVASESVAFGRNYLNATNYREVAPGELIVIDQNGIKPYQLLVPQQKQSCMFQAVYMKRPESDFEGESVYLIRERLGIEIAKHYRPKVDMVVPVPESGLPVGYGYSLATGIPVRMGIVKDRYEFERSFMRGVQADREKVVNKKLNIIEKVVKDKSVLDTDDCQVRRTTMKRIIAEQRHYGATEVHVAFSCPPVISECRYGIDFYNKDLIARPYAGMTPEEINREIAKLIGADSVYYQTLDGLVNGIGVPKENLCLSCLTESYVQPGSFTTEEERKR